MLVCAVLYACGAPSAARARSVGPPPISGTCAGGKCSGFVDGVPFSIERPPNWTGTLLLWSHGYRDPVTGTHVEHGGRAVDAPNPAVADALIARGFALGGADAPGGWVVDDEVRAAERLHSWFAAHVATPKRTLVWGESLGGLVAEVVAERHPDWVSGSGPECATLGGSIRKFNLDLDAAYAVQRLLLPSMRLRGYQSAVDARTDLAAARLALSADDAKTRARVALIAALVGAPARTAHHDGRTPSSRLAAWREGVLDDLDSATVRRVYLDSRLKGDPSGNEDVDYSARLDAVTAEAIDAIEPGTVVSSLSLLSTGPRLRPDPGAVAEVERMGEPSGNLHHPTITLHTVADPQVPVQNERVFADEVARHRAGANLLQLYTVPPDIYGDSVRAPYGAGHCLFTDEERIAHVALLDAWVRTGAAPDRKGVAAAVRGPGGFTTDYSPERWPASGNEVVPRT
ncbi:MAG: DUF6351 family protein [Acidimicrobiales bacterium]